MLNIAPVHRPWGHRAIHDIAMMTLVLTSIVCLFLSSPCSAYSPNVNHRAIAGLWKLKQIPTSSSVSYPLKEFTVYPKVPNKSKTNKNNSKEVLLMLKEDGSFQQYSNHEQKAPDKLPFFEHSEAKEKTAVLDRYCEFGKLKGKWNLVDGKLILAADRPMSDDGSTSSIPNISDDAPDTFLEGQVVSKTEKALYDNPVLRTQSDDPQVDNSDATDASMSNKVKLDASVGNRNEAKSSRDGRGTGSSVLDTHLSVPKGQVNVGRFTYPQRHPSFFDAPMFKPRASGNFELKQVLGTLNTQQEQDDEFKEKFSTSDFHDKTFLLTSHPIPEHQPKGDIRWSIKYNKFVEDPPLKSKKQKYEDKMTDQPLQTIRVLEMKFFANNTFATIGGMGGSAILRGRFSIIGKEKDQLWLQVLLFGFGRSVSGSVFSEGGSLTKDDEKTYWGKIEYKDNQSTEGDVESIDAQSGADSTISDPKMDGSDPEKETDRKLIVKGSVLFGYGLEPMPVGQFILAETSSAEDNDFDDEDDEDTDDNEDYNNFNSDSFMVDPDDNIFQ